MKNRMKNDRATLKKLMFAVTKLVHKNHLNTTFLNPPVKSLFYHFLFLIAFRKKNRYLPTHRKNVGLHYNKQFLRMAYYNQV